MFLDRLMVVLYKKMETCCTCAASPLGLIRKGVTIRAFRGCEAAPSHLLRGSYISRTLSAIYHPYQDTYDI